MKFRVDGSHITIEADAEFQAIAEEARSLTGLNPDKRILYPNIGFTGATSLSTALGRMFSYAMLFFDNFDVPDQTPLAERINRFCKGKRLICLHHRAPNVGFVFGEDLNTIQMLRNPVKVYLSNYFWDKKIVESSGGPNEDWPIQVAIARGMTLEQYATEWVGEHYRNEVSRKIVTNSLKVSDFGSVKELYAYAQSLTDNQLYDSVERELAKYNLVALAEYMSEAVFIIGAALDQPHIPLWEILGKSDAPAPSSISPLIRNALAQNSEIDQAMYQLYRKRFEQSYGSIIERFRASIPTLMKDDLELLQKTALQQSLTSVGATGVLPVAQDGGIIELYETSALAAHRIEWRVSKTSSTCTVSLLVRSGRRDSVRIELLPADFATNAAVHFKLEGCGSIPYADGSISWPEVVAEIEPQAGGWYRCRVSAPIPGDTVVAWIGTVDAKGQYMFEGEDCLGLSFHLLEVIDGPITML